jgi:hypothetical protein
MNIPLETLIAFAFGILLGCLPAFNVRKRVRFLEHVIEIRNNLFGREAILLNDQLVQSKFTAFGGTHKFAIGQDQAEVHIRLRWHLLAPRIRVTVSGQTIYEE